MAETARVPESSDDPVFDDIRPCNDSEVESELGKVLADEQVISSILRFRYPILSRHFAFVLSPLVRRYLKSRAAGIRTIRDFQDRVADFMTHVSNTTTDGVTYEGFDTLSADRGYLFISNHRDISLDPAYVDMGLYHSHLPTVRIAIGDNLLRMPAATALMRLNKSFIVKRSVASPRQKLMEFNRLSSYIGLSISEGHSVWIAQREGRAKDGDDHTEDAVLKMLSLRGRQLKMDFASYMSTLNIVPVSITYEFDPNDEAKARELDERERHGGQYEKEENEDIETITRGIRGYKGRVRVVAGAPLKDGFSNPAELAAIIDRFIFTNYAMYPSTLISAGITEGVTPEEQKKFSARLAKSPEHLRARIRAMYARPWQNLQQLKTV